MLWEGECATRASSRLGACLLLESGVRRCQREGGACSQSQLKAGSLLVVKIRGETVPKGALGLQPHLGWTSGVSFSFSLMQFQIRALESQKRQQEIVLRRKTQEVRKGGFLHIAPSFHGGLGPSAWLGEIPSFRQGCLWEWGPQKAGRGFMAQELGGRWVWAAAEFSIPSSRAWWQGWAMREEREPHEAQMSLGFAALLLSDLWGPGGDAGGFRLGEAAQLTPFALHLRESLGWPPKLCVLW